MIHLITFSPTGGTLRVCEQIAKGMGREMFHTDLSLQPKDLRLPEIKEDDMIVVGMPVFAGRVPQTAVERFRKIKGNGARCVVVAVYGNRAYDDALLEMYDVATAMGLHVITAVAGIAEHSIAREYGTGRPDKEDCCELTRFGKTIMENIENGRTSTILNIPGNRPYRELHKGACPEADNSCTACGKCVAGCPTEAILSDNPRMTDKDRCISCMRCVTLCPNGARGIGNMAAMISERLKPLCSTRKNNEIIMGL